MSHKPDQGILRLSALSIPHALDSESDGTLNIVLLTVAQRNPTAALGVRIKGACSNGQREMTFKTRGMWGK